MVAEQWRQAPADAQIDPSLSVPHSGIVPAVRAKVRFLSRIDERILEFIAALRTAGLRVSVAESTDALRALEHTGMAEPGLLRGVLHATLVKERADLPVFDRRGQEGLMLSWPLSVGARRRRTPTESERVPGPPAPTPPPGPSLVT
jgi:hypothetical protein